MSYTQCPTHNVLHTMSYTQCPTHNVLHTMSYTQCPTHNVLHTMSYTQCHTHNVIHTMSYTQCHTHNVIHTMSYTQCHTHNVIHTIVLHTETLGWKFTSEESMLRGNSTNVLNNHLFFVESANYLRPSYIYSAGDRICSLATKDASTRLLKDPAVCFFNNPPKFEFHALDFNYQEGRIYFSDTKFLVKTIRRANMTNKSDNEVIVYGTGDVEGKKWWRGNYRFFCTVRVPLYHVGGSMNVIWTTGPESTQNLVTILI